MKDFMDHVNRDFGFAFSTYDELFRWSVEHPADFWGAFWHFSGIRYSVDYERVVDDPKKMPGAKWFEGARLNFAENLLSRRDDKTAIIFRGEAEFERRISYAELYEQVHRVAEALKKTGVKKGDRVAGFIPNMPEAIIAMLGAASIGAIWSSSSPDFGIKGVLDRFSQIEPKVIFAADGYYYKGRKFDSQEKLKGILHELPSVEKVVLINYTDTVDTGSVPNAVSWEDFAVPVGGEMSFEQLPFDHPLYIMYSSGDGRKRT